MNPWALACTEIMDQRLSELGYKLKDVSVGENVHTFM